MLIVAFQFPFQAHLLEDVAAMAREYVRHVISSVKNISLGTMPQGSNPEMNSTEANPATGFNITSESTFAVNLANLVCQSYRQVKNCLFLFLANPRLWFMNSYSIQFKQQLTGVRKMKKVLILRACAGLFDIVYLIICIWMKFAYLLELYYYLSILSSVGVALMVIIFSLMKVGFYMFKYLKQISENGSHAAFILVLGILWHLTMFE